MKKEQFQFTKAHMQAWDQQHYLSYIRKLTNEAQSAYLFFSVCDPSMFASLHPSIKSVCLNGLLKDLVFFCDDKSKEKFRSFGFRAMDLKRLVPLQNITDQLDKIAEDSNFIFFKHYALRYAHMYAYARIAYDFGGYFLRDLQAHYQDDTLDPNRYLNNIYDQRKYHGGTPPKEKDLVKQWLHKRIDQLSSVFGESTTKKILERQVSGRNLECFFLRWITQSCLPAQDNDAFYAKFFELFRLLVSDKEPFIDLDEVEESGHWEGMTYVGYKAKWVRNLIRGVSSDFGSLEYIKLEEFAVK